jgi:Uncharacterized protein conserved in bacteria (DUF2147)
MKRLLAIAAFLLASSAAQAQYSFEYGGRTIRIDPDRGTVSIPGVYDNTGRKAKRPHSNQESGHSKPSPQEAKSDPQAAPSPAPADTAAAPAAAVPAPANSATSPEPSTATANNAPADAAVSPPPSGTAPIVLKESAPPRPDPSPALAAVPPSAPAPAPVQRPQGPVPAAAAVRDANSPVGVWLTEEKEGKVRIEQCGANLCGYSVDAKSNLNGEQVLINMRPNKDAKWSGRILDPNTGSTYDSTIALKGDVLRVQGCAFGGMFCGGQTWTRVN